LPAVLLDRLTDQTTNIHAQSHNYCL